MSITIQNLSVLVPDPRLWGEGLTPVVNCLEGSPGRLLFSYHAFQAKRKPRPYGQSPK